MTEKIITVTVPGDIDTTPAGIPARMDWTGHPQRTPRAVQEARTVWRMTCRILSALFVVALVSAIVAVQIGADRDMCLATALWAITGAAVTAAWSEDTPEWYLKEAEKE